jgi:hypothetical protein
LGITFVLSHVGFEVSKKLKSSDFMPEINNCVIVPIGTSRLFVTDNSDNALYPMRSKLLLFEDGRLIGPPHSVHQVIRDLGKGAFSHWYSHLYFSASDNSNPIENGRTYSVKIQISMVPVFYQIIFAITAVLVLMLILRSSKSSKSHPKKIIGATVITFVTAFTACFYVAFIACGTNIVESQNAMFAVFITATISALIIAHASREKMTSFFIYLVIIFSAFPSIIVLDILSFMHVVSVGKAHDISVIPFQVKILTREGYLTSTMQRFFKKRAENICGQISSYLNNEMSFYEPRNISVETDRIGLRNPKGASEKQEDVLIMGDSFAFGYATDYPKTFAGIISSSMSRLNTYNIGVYGHSPTQQIILLKHLLENRMLQLSPSADIFFIFQEGQDITDPSAYSRKYSKKDFLFMLIDDYRKTSFTRMFSCLIPRYALSRKNEVINGSTSKVPFKYDYIVFKSPEIGPMGFYMGLVRNTQTSIYDKDIALSIFEQSKIEEGFAELSELSQKHDFKVHIVYLPEKSRLYSRFFKELPNLEATNDTWKNKTRATAEKYGFDFIDLLPIFKAVADSRILLYWRDDDHLNEGGNKLLAEIIMSKIFSPKTIDEGTESKK